MAEPASMDGESRHVTLTRGRDDGDADATPPLLRVRDDALVKRGRELMAISQRGDNAQRQAASAEVDDLVRLAHKGRDPHVVAELLRTAGIVRLVTPGRLEGVRTTLDELLDHAREHALIVAEADTYALRANLVFRQDPESHVVLDEVANALAIIEYELPGTSSLSAEEGAEQVARALSDTAIVLHHLDIHEMSSSLLARGQVQLELAGESHGMVVLLFNRVRSLLLWGLQLERSGQPDNAADRFAEAAALAGAVEEHWGAHLFPDRVDRIAADQVVVFAVAFAMHHPGGEHLDRLSALREHSVFPDDPILLDIAQARCLDAAGRNAEAVGLLETQPHDHVPVDKAEPAVRLSLVREIARLERRRVDGDRAWLRYAESLEAGLLSLQRARLSALRARIEHAALRRRHHALALQALQDPLTGLPNRRAWEQSLDGMAAASPGEPMAVAMIDLDGFKQTNDRYSHAVGDAVLKTIAATLRRLVRVDDLIARFGGDEFVALLPSTSLATATAVFERAVSEVAALDGNLSRGVTLSIGVTAVRPSEHPRAALARADEAMYRAKQQGGGQVFTTR